MNTDKIKEIFLSSTHPKLYEILHAGVQEVYMCPYVLHACKLEYFILYKISVSHSFGLGNYKLASCPYVLILGCRAQVRMFKCLSSGGIMKGASYLLHLKLPLHL